MSITQTESVIYTEELSPIEWYHEK